VQGLEPILRDHGMPYWHMKEAPGPSGVFKRGDREEMREVSIALHDLKARSSGGYAIFRMSTSCRVRRCMVCAASALIRSAVTGA
jgi:hypothetical protein